MSDLDRLRAVAPTVSAARALASLGQIIDQTPTPAGQRGRQRATVALTPKG